MKCFPPSRNVAGLSAVLLALAIHSTASAQVGAWEWTEVDPTLRPQVLHGADLDLDGDALLTASPQNAISVAGVIGRWQPDVLMAPSLHGNQHPDHSRAGRLVR